MKSIEDVKTYKYYIDNKIYYGQGFQESHVREALAYRLGYPSNMLNVGSQSFNRFEKTYVINSIMPVRSLAKKLRINGNIKEMSIGEIANKSHLDINGVKNTISNSLRILQEDIDDFPTDKPIRRLFSKSLLKIKVKTHKIISNGLYKDPIIICKVETAISNIKKLLALDYNLIFELENIESNIGKLIYTCLNLESELNKEYNKNNFKLKEKLNDFKNELSDYQNLNNQLLSRNYNTAYFVSSNYSYKNFNEMVEDFDKVYEKLRIKLKRYYIADVIDPKTGFTLLELLDSFVLTKRLNNHYINKIDYLT
jgi:hypothetical protein